MSSIPIETNVTSSDNLDSSSVSSATKYVSSTTKSENNTSSENKPIGPHTHNIVNNVCAVCGKYNLGNLLILGDSYSTFEGYIPSGYAPWYINGSNSQETDVTNVGQTWWTLLCENSIINLLRNDSWSGTTICNTTYGENGSRSSFITRFDNLVANGYFKKKAHCKMNLQ